MDGQASSILDILSFKLSGQVTGPLYLEYKSKRREIDRIWAKPDNAYVSLQEYESTVDALLAMSLFYRHVLGHIQGASSLYTSISKRLGKDNECAIRVGSTIIDDDQQRQLQATVIRFSKLLDRYQIGMWFFEFSETVEFLRNCKELLKIREYEVDDTV